MTIALNQKLAHTIDRMRVAGIKPAYIMLANSDQEGLNEELAWPQTAKLTTFQCIPVVAGPVTGVIITLDEGAR